MRINIYAEELPSTPDYERVSKLSDTGIVYFGARLYLKSHSDMHHTCKDDDRNAITIWGPRIKVAAILRAMANEMDPSPLRAMANEMDPPPESAHRRRG